MTARSSVSFAPAAPLDEALVVGERFARLLDDVGEGALPDKHHDDGVSGVLSLP